MQESTAAHTTHKTEMTPISDHIPNLTKHKHVHRNQNCCQSQTKLQITVKMKLTNTFQNSVGWQMCPRHAKERNSPHKTKWWFLQQNNCHNTHQTTHSSVAWRHLSQLHLPPRPAWKIVAPEYCTWSSSRTTLTSAIRPWHAYSRTTEPDKFPKAITSSLRSQLIKTQYYGEAQLTPTASST